MSWFSVSSISPASWFLSLCLSTEQREQDEVENITSRVRKSRKEDIYQVTFYTSCSQFLISSQTRNIISSQTGNKERAGSNQWKQNLIIIWEMKEESRENPWWLSWFVCFMMQVLCPFAHLPLRVSNDRSKDASAWLPDKGLQPYSWRSWKRVYFKHFLWFILKLLAFCVIIVVVILLSSHARNKIRVRDTIRVVWCTCD